MRMSLGRPPAPAMSRSNVVPKMSDSCTSFNIASKSPKGSCTKAHCSPRIASGRGSGGLRSKENKDCTLSLYLGSFLYTVSRRSCIHDMMVKHLLLGMGLIWHSLRALVMMVCIWPLKKRARSGLWAPGLDSTDSMALLSSALLILEFGKYSEYSKLRSGSQMSSSHTFFPRSSSNGREQKSISHSGDEETSLLLVGLLGLACWASICVPTSCALA
mmetsp:Transcript_2311/g.5928  ORF Transcript_2311/g.5928 Transcript_2311/m.5928 type:complete len:216 (-) Transcript_2311:263-910(-)